MGFGPQLVDIDGDGLDDMISGNWMSQVIWFRGNQDGTFAAGEPLKDATNELIRVDYGVHARATDWDADGDLDLLVGTVDATDEGNIYLIRNEGAVGANAFGTPKRLTAGGQPIVATKGDAAPVASDWDDDGKMDLVIGCGDGSVIYYRNVGTRQEPTFESFETLIAPPLPEDDRGTRAKPCVVDWNGDGSLDLLVGDFGKPFEKVLSTEEVQWREEARQQQADFLKTWANEFQTYRQLLTRSLAASEDNEDLQQQLSRRRAELVRLNSIRSRYGEQEQALQPGNQYHGRVWVFLRKKIDAQHAIAVDPVFHRQAVNADDEPTQARPVVVAANIAPANAAPGDLVTLTVRVRTAANWHIYALQNSGIGVATRLALELPNGITAHGDWSYQDAIAQTAKDGKAIYQGEFTLRRSLQLAPNLSPGTSEIRCRVFYQACNDTVCLPPTQVDLSASVEVQPE